MVKMTKYNVLKLYSKLFKIATRRGNGGLSTLVLLSSALAKSASCKRRLNWSVLQLFHQLLLQNGTQHLFGLEGLKNTTFVRRMISNNCLCDIFSKSYFTCYFHRPGIKITITESGTCRKIIFLKHGGRCHFALHFERYDFVIRNTNETIINHRASHCRISLITRVDEVVFFFQ